MSTLLDANLLIALAAQDHVHHDLVEDWLGGQAEGFATCPLTQGALLRMLLRRGATAASADDILRGFTSDARHEFWLDDLGFVDVRLVGVVGHRQVTDAYLAGLARHRGSRLATMDRGLAALHPDVSVLVSAG